MLPSPCRSCGSHGGALVLDLGLQPLANGLLEPERLGQPEPTYPLRLAVCQACWLLQITDVVPPESLFRDYVYHSSFSDQMLAHARDAVASHVGRFGLGPESFVIEVASNDGYLLRNFVARGIPCLGIEPATRIAEAARAKGVPTLDRFFDPETARTLEAEGTRADLLLANNVLAHAPQINDFLSAVKQVLAADGVAVFEFPYACDLIERGEFDTIYHEHVFYLSLTSLTPLLARNGLHVFDVERLGIHGGSLRVFASARPTPASSAVSAMLAEEGQRGVSALAYYESFTNRVEKIRADLLALLRDLRGAGQRVAAYGASAKGSTLLNFLGIGRDGCDCIDFVADRSTVKQGKLTPGSHLPIVAPAELLSRRPDYTLLLTWNFADEILAQQADYRAAGGRFIIPVPVVEVV